MENKSENSREDELFTTRDIILATTLRDYGFDLHSVDFQIEGANPWPVGYFSFENTGKLRKTASDFFNKKTLVEPQTHNENFRNLKSQVTSGRDNPRSGRIRAIDIGK